MEVKWLEETVMGHKSIGLLQARFFLFFLSWLLFRADSTPKYFADEMFFFF